MVRLARVLVFVGTCAFIAGCAATERKAISGVAGEPVTKAGATTGEERKVSRFHRIRVSSAIDATVTVGSPQIITSQSTGASSIHSE